MLVRNSRQRATRLQYVARRDETVSPCRVFIVLRIPDRAHRGPRGGFAI